MSDQLTDIQSRLNQIYSELMGSDLSKRGGLIMNVQELRGQVDQLNARMQRIESNQSIVRIAIYATAFGLFIGALIFGFMSIKEVLSLTK